MGELDLVKWFIANTRPGARSKVRVGPGDDAAVLAATGTGEIVFTVDEVVEGTHFRLSGSAPPCYERLGLSAGARADSASLRKSAGACVVEPGRSRTRRKGRPLCNLGSGLGPAARGRDVGYKAHASATSDLAAMGAEPLGAVAAVALRRRGAGRLGREIHAGLQESARATGCPLVGGNVTETSGPVTLSVAVLGRAPNGGAFLRSGAKAGHAIYVTGELGGSVLGRHLRPVPRLEEARLLRRAGGVGAVIDVSDGLALDLFRVCQASKVGAVVEAERVPVSQAARRLARKTGTSPLEHALGDGEDYELLFTIDARAAERLEGTWKLRTRLTRIGEILPKRRGLMIREGGRARPLAARGYTHL